MFDWRTVGHHWKQFEPFSFNICPQEQEFPQINSGFELNLQLLEDGPFSLAWGLNIFESEIEKTDFLMKIFVLIKMKDQSSVGQDVFADELNFVFFPEVFNLSEFLFDDILLSGKKSDLWNFILNINDVRMSIKFITSDVSASLTSEE